MPIINSSDKRGRYYKWGKSGKKYYYNTERGKKRAKSKAIAQGRAILFGRLKNKDGDFVLKFK